MDKDGADLVLKWYLDLEGRFEVLLQTVPLTPDTEKVFLPGLSSIILEACSLLDTVLRDGYGGASKAKDANIRDYAKYYEPKLKLSKARTIFYHHQGRLVCPFEKWLSSSGEYEPLQWWQSYNKLKHDRIASYSLSTFRTALLALASLHLVISRLPVFVDSLLRHNMICFGKWADRYVLSVLRGEDSGSDVTVMIESSLFGTPAGNAEFPELITEIRPWVFESGRKLWRYIGSRY